MTNFEGDRKGFEERDAQVLSVSADSVFLHKVFAEKMGSIGYSMLSDFYPHGAVTADSDVGCHRWIFLRRPIPDPPELLYYIVSKT